MDLLKFAKKLWYIRKQLVLIITPGLLLPLLFVLPEKVGCRIQTLSHHNRLVIPLVFRQFFKDRCTQEFTSLYLPVWPCSLRWGGAQHNMTNDDTIQNNKFETISASVCVSLTQRFHDSKQVD